MVWWRSEAEVSTGIIRAASISIYEGKVSVLIELIERPDREQSMVSLVWVEFSRADSFVHLNPEV